METRINEQGEIEIVNKMTAQEYINNKMMIIEMLQEQIANMAEEVNREIAELRALTTPVELDSGLDGE